MASKTFYECGCMEQGDQFFLCSKHKGRGVVATGPLKLEPADSPHPTEQPIQEEMIDRWVGAVAGDGAMAGIAAMNLKQMILQEQAIVRGALLSRVQALPQTVDHRTTGDGYFERVPLVRLADVVKMLTEGQ